MRKLAVFAFLVTAATGLPAAAANLSGMVEVVDGDTIDIGSNRIRINGIDAPELGQKCDDEKSRRWSCGKAAAKELARMAGGKNATCRIEVPDDGMGRKVATCFVGGKDIGEHMMLAGMAWAFVKYSNAYVRQESVARKAKLGIWRAQSQPAWEYRSDRWKVAMQKAPNRCPIKGNISGRGKIYHVPWSSSYADTGIDEGRGERWFCSEEEAIAAGWRAPMRR